MSKERRNTQTVLDECRDKMRGCRLLAFGDLDTGLVLRTSSDHACQREDLDLYCETAAEFFASTGSARELFEDDGDPVSVMVAGFSAQETLICARSSSSAGEFALAKVQGAECLKSALKALNAVAHKIADEIE